MTDDLLAVGDLTYTLVINAVNESQAYDVVEAHARVATRRSNRTAFSGSDVRLVTVDFDHEQDAEHDESANGVRRALERRLGEWQDRDWHTFDQGAGFPQGGLLMWKRGLMRGRRT